MGPVGQHVPPPPGYYMPVDGVYLPYGMIDLQTSRKILLPVNFEGKHTCQASYSLGFKSEHCWPNNAFL